MTLTLLVLSAAAYVTGGMPTGVLFGRLAGRDPRASGSGNIGATNDTGILHGIHDVLDLDRRQTTPLHAALDDSLDKPSRVLIGQEQD